MRRIPGLSPFIAVGDVSRFDCAWFFSRAEELRAEKDLLTGECPLNVLSNIPIERLSQDFADPATNRLTRTDAEPILVGSVDEQVALVAVNLGDQCGQGIGNQVEPALALDQGKFGPSDGADESAGPRSGASGEPQRGRRDHVAAILLPERRRTEMDRAARREKALADAPALEFPPVIRRRQGPDRR